MVGLTIEKVTISEPNYTQWIYQRTIEYEPGFAAEPIGMQIDENNNLIYLVYDMGGSKLKVFDLNDGTLKFDSGAGVYFYQNLTEGVHVIRFGNSKYGSSSLGKYLCLKKADEKTLQVFSAPAISALWERDISLDVVGATSKFFMISPTGKYIVTTDANIVRPYIYVYSGS